MGDEVVSWVGADRRRLCHGFGSVGGVRESVLENNFRNAYMYLPSYIQLIDYG